MQTTSMYIAQTALPGAMHNEAGGSVRDLTPLADTTSTLNQATNETIKSFSQFDKVCASSEGGPGLNFGEQIAGRSILGTSRQLSRLS